MASRIFLLSLSVISFKTFAWGTVGHMTAGYIAEAKLTPATRAAVSKILEGKSLAEVSNWADELRSSNTYRQTNWYHFEKVFDGVSYIDNLKAMPEWQQRKGGAIGAILVANEILRQPNSSRSARRDALKFLVHFVADLHQPLHSGRPEDKGGVEMMIEWQGSPMSLHRLWDSGMIRTGHPDYFTGPRSDDRASRFYSADLLKRFARQNIPQTLDPEIWLNESLALRNAAYDPTYKSDQRAYQATHLPTIDLRLYAAGTRLADVLNSVFSGAPISRQEKDLWRRIEAVVGDIYQVISFRR